MFKEVHHPIMKDLEYFDLYDPQDDRHVGQIWYKDGTYRAFLYNQFSDLLGVEERMEGMPTYTTAYQWLMGGHAVQKTRTITKEELDKATADLRYQRWVQEMSDDFAYTNGKIDPYDRALARVYHIGKMAGIY